MGLYSMALPDIGEGIAEAELDAWSVKIGDVVTEDDVLCAVMTDKAVIEIPSPVTGKVIWLAGDAGDTLAIGAALVQLEVPGDGNQHNTTATDTTDTTDADGTGAEATTNTITADSPGKIDQQPSQPKHHQTDQPIGPPPSATTTNAKPLAAPSVRKAARDAGVDLYEVQGTGPSLRITREDLAAFIANSAGVSTTDGQDTPRRVTGKAVGGTDIKVKGMRRVIAEKMALSKARIPHITIIEEIDVTDLEVLRSTLNQQHAASKGKLTILPFVMAAIVKSVAEKPEMNATFDDDAGIIHQSNPVHIGIAAQTPNGLTVPVVRHAEAASLWGNAAEITRLSGAVRDGKATRKELSGSTITVTSLGPLGAIATTPIINHPEVAIVGINKIAVRPLWDGTAFQPRKMMNISSSFDHRVIDGWDAAVFVQHLKTLLETPALMFIET